MRILIATIRKRRAQIQRKTKSGASSILVFWQILSVYESPAEMQDLERYWKIGTEDAGCASRDVPKVDLTSHLTLSDVRGLHI